MKRSILRFASALVVLSTVFLTGCSKDKDDESGSTVTPVEAKTISDLNATTKVYINLKTGATVSAAEANATNWDLSVLGEGRTLVLGVNSGTNGTGTAGAQIVETGFDDLAEAPAEGYLAGTEAIGDYLKWSTYTGSTTTPNHAILPKPGLSIVVRTADGKYSKIQIVSLYQGNPNTSTEAFANLATRPAFGYLTFRYATQTENTRRFK